MQQPTIWPSGQLVKFSVCRGSSMLAIAGVPTAVPSCGGHLLLRVQMPCRVCLHWAWLGAAEHQRCAFAAGAWQRLLGVREIHGLGRIGDS